MKDIYHFGIKLKRKKKSLDLQRWDFFDQIQYFYPT